MSKRPPSSGGMKEEDASVCQLLMWDLYLPMPGDWSLGFRQHQEVGLGAGDHQYHIAESSPQIRHLFPSDSNSTCNLISRFLSCII